jgi:cardiolipin synthase
MDLTSAFSWASLYLISEWIIRFLMLVIIPFRRSPEAAKGWLLFGFFLPWPAVILYLLIGRPDYPKWRRMQFERLPHVLKEETSYVRELNARQEPDLPSNLNQAAQLIQNLGHFPALSGNEAELLSRYDETLNRIVADIDAAADHVHLIFYLFAYDTSGKKIITALRRAVERGVTCRVLIDALGSHAWASHVMKALAEAGVTAHLVLPLRFPRRRSTRADLRNHRKIVVIDGQGGYIGSQNIVDADFNPRVTNQELVVRVCGPVVLELQAVFMADWFLETGEVLKGPALFPGSASEGNIVAQALPSGPDYPGAGIERVIEALIHGARDRIVITTPYFVPNESLLHALETAVLRGVEVHVILSKPVDQTLVSLAQRSYYTELLEAGIKIHLYRDKLLHAKHLSIDRDVALIGSSNMDMRSFTLNSEISLVLFDRELSERLQAEQIRYFAGSDLLLEKAWRTRSLVRKVIENMARLLTPLL